MSLGLTKCNMLNKVVFLEILKYIITLIHVYQQELYENVSHEANPASYKLTDLKYKLRSEIL